MKNIVISSLLAATVMFSGCGSDSATEDSSALITGQLVDSYLENVDYICEDGTTGLTDANGTFSCESLPVRFQLGGLSLGSLDTITTDKQVFPQDLLGIAREDINNTQLRAMARFLQSCDDDNNSENGIKIKEEVKTQLRSGNFDGLEIANYASDAQLTLKDEDEAVAHLVRTTAFVKAVDDLDDDMPREIRDILLTPKSELTQEVRDTLAYMGNEERLAYDVYNKLYAGHLADGVEIKQLTNIANKAESKHIQAVQMLIRKYVESESNFTNIDMTELSYKDTNLSDMQAGVYDIQAIQDLYNTLIAEGNVSKQAALEVGCKIEVIDVNDLRADIAIAEDINATDVVETFNFLLNGSYSHYWSFNKGLVNMGITAGCGVLGDEYAKTEEDYPVQEHGSDSDDDMKDSDHEMQGEGHGRDDDSSEGSDS